MSSPARIAELTDFRGRAVADAAERIAGGASLTPARLSAALADGAIDPATAKQVWHLLAAFGRHDSVA